MDDADARGMNLASEEKPKRNHKANGKPHGGLRRGAGRPVGKKDVLPRGMVKALKVAGLRVPETATTAEREVADLAFSRLVDVMNEKVYHQNAFPVLTAARLVREEICGPIPKKLEHAGNNGQPIVFKIEET